MTNSDPTGRIRELEADNARLRRLLDNRNAPGELRHRLSNTLAMLRVIIKKSAESGRGTEAYVAHLDDRIDALARAQAFADERGGVDLHLLVTDELARYKTHEGENFAIAGPPVRLHARAGQVLGLAIHELAVNALEHGALAAGHLDVRWDLEEETPPCYLTLRWKERHDGAPEAGPAGFGTEVITQTLPYELDAETDLVLEPDGLRCVIRVPFTERVGKLDTE